MLVKGSLIWSEASLIHRIGISIDDLLMSNLFITSCTSFVSIPRNIKLFKNDLFMYSVGSVLVEGIFPASVDPTEVKYELS